MTTPVPSARPLRGLLESDPVVATAGVSLLADALRDLLAKASDWDRATRPLENR